MSLSDINEKPSFLIFKKVGHHCPILALYCMWYFYHVKNTNNTKQTEYNKIPPLE